MTQPAGRRLALVVATTEYDDNRLERLAAPLSDALQLARALADFGDFEVDTLVNAEAQTVQRRFEKFCKTGRNRQDTLFVYLTGHGVKDHDGNLYFALRDTDRDLLRTTALSADLLGAILNDSPARSQILMLDCCYSGAMARALRPKGSGDVDLVGSFGGGRGRVVLAASSAIEQAWEGEQGSVYTHAVVDGITSGQADLNHDGRITAAELHGHVVDRLRVEGRQTPRKFEFDEAGELVVARAGSQPGQAAVGAVVPTARAVVPPLSPPPSPSPKPVHDRKGISTWIPGMIAIALAAVLGTLWATGAINPTGPTLPPVTTNPTEASGREWVEELIETWDSNERGWLVGDSSDEFASYSTEVSSGLFQVAMASSVTDWTFWNMVPFALTGSEFYLEVSATNTGGETRCGLAVSTVGGREVTVVGLGGGRVLARHFVDGVATDLSRLGAPVASAANTEIGILVEGGRAFIYINDVALGNFEAASLASTDLVGISASGDLQSSCAFEYLTLHTR
jgi:hypothetical protein